MGESKPGLVEAEVSGGANHRFPGRRLGFAHRITGSPKPGCSTSALSTITHDAARNPFHQIMGSGKRSGGSRHAVVPD